MSLSEGARPCTHKPGGVMRLKQCLLCPYSDRLRAAAQYVAMCQKRTHALQRLRGDIEQPHHALAAIASILPY